MSAGITFWCDSESAWGSCPQTVSFKTTDLPAARAAAERLGWQLKASGDLCAHDHAPKPQPVRRTPRRIR